jgi:PAS domain S-box-containing protein
LRTLADLRPGEHACQIHTSEEERISAASAFLAAAAGKGEGALRICEPGPAAEAPLGGECRTVTVREAFFPEGSFSPEGAWAFLRAEAERAAAAGAPSLRVAVEAGWVQRAVPGAERFLEFEAGLHEALAGVRASVLCQYDRRLFDPAELLNVVASHPLMVIGSHLVDNFYYVPKENLAVSDFLGSMLDHWLENLAGRTRVRQAEQERTRLAMAVEQSGEAVVLFDLAGTAQYVNPAFERITGLRFEEAVGTRAVPLSEEGGEGGRGSEIRNALSMGLSWSGRISTRRKDGVTRELDAVVSTIREKDGNAVGSLAILRDVTAERRMEEELRQSQKMEAVGRLAGGVAHDFNNLLTAITGYAELLAERAGDGTPLRKEVDEILRAAERGSDLTRQLLAFGRKQSLRSRPVEVNGVVSGIEKMLRRLIGEDVELVVSLSPTPAVVMGDPGQLEQVLLNLVVNARDAMPSGGRLAIEVATACPAGGRGHGESVLLTVADTGCGMDEETKARIFEPFFTTKEEGKGTGLGLSTVYGIVHQFDGTVEVESSPGRGASFRVELPAWGGEEEGGEEAGAGAPAARVSGKETLLVVEDEEQVRSLVRRVLQGRGYRVFEAATPAEAMRVCEAIPGEIQMLLVDVVLPQTGGRKLAEHLLLVRPRMKVLFMSGYADDRLVGQGLLGGGVPFLQKPFTAEVLASAVRGVLDGAREA